MKIQYINRVTGTLETEQPPAEGMLKFLYGNPLGKYTLLPLIKRKFLSEWYGRRMNSKASAKKIASFVQSLGIDMLESKKSIEEFSSFNEFFYRELKASARPLGTGLVSPGDGRLLAFERVHEVGNFYVKGQKFELANFFGDTKLAEAYSQASLLILRLAPNDYHRYHFPYAGRASASKLIQGSYYSVSPHALFYNFAKVFCENKREICSLRIEGKQDLLIIPVGATMVGSINSTYQPGSEVEKGQEMGYFAFGGSTIVLLFSPEDFVIDADILEYTKQGRECFVKMGEQIARPK